jgi:serine/threonine-protein kinase HipA
MTRAASVTISGHLAGVLEEHAGETRFTYSPEWLASPGATPVSLTLPLRAEVYVHQGLHPFFENLLPEGWLFDLSSKKLKISKDDAFGMLLATCGDCIGAVEITPIGPEGDGTGLGNYGHGFVDGSGYGHGDPSSFHQEG